MTFPEKPTVENLSDLPVLRRFPGFRSSMGAGNMVTEKLTEGIFSGAGTDSEATHDVVAADVDWIGSIQETPALPGPQTPEADLTGLEREHAADRNPITMDRPWKRTISRGSS